MVVREAMLTTSLTVIRDINSGKRTFTTYESFGRVCITWIRRSTRTGCYHEELPMSKVSYACIECF